ncbi:MAG TPA: TonB-dependent receptor [Vicinamibacterales bacterium]|nr:TonB-dependent receptor [Vicinamibacterales bacterium]
MPRTTGRSGPLFPVLFRFVAILVFTLVVAAPAAAEPVRGRVLDPHARPVAGADVLILRGSQVVATTRTLADGRFGPISIATGDYEIVAAAPGLRSRAMPVAVKAGGTVEIDLTLAVTAVHESVLVSAAQVDQPLTRATDSVTVITRAEIETRQIESVADALRVLPGLAVLASGGRGAVTSLFPRGGESDYTLVLVDGVAQNAFGGSMDFAHLSTGEIERIEVVRGPQSALYGGGAIGAIVHLITQHGGPQRVGGSFEAGGESTQRATAFTTGSHHAWRWGLSLDGLRTDGDTRVLAGADGRVSNADYTRASGAGSLSWSDAPTRHVRVDARIGRSERGFPGPYGSDPMDRYDGVDLISRGITQFRSVAGTAAFRAGSITHRARATWSGAESDFISPFGGSDDRTRRVTGRYQADAAAGRIDLSAGWEVLHERAENTFIFGEQAQAVPVSRSISGWFVEGRPALGPRAFLTAGARVERIERTALEGDRHAPRPAFEADVVWSVNPKVSFAWFLTLPEGGTWTKIRAGAGTGIKPPTAFEIAYTDNPGLKPERSRSFDLGIEHGLAGSTVILDATWFANRYDELIVVVGGEYAGASRYRTDNIANARARGLELGARVRPTETVSIRGAWTILDTRILGVDGAESEAPPPYRLGDELVRRPRHQASLEVGWSHSRAAAFALITGRGETRDLEPNFATEVFDNEGYVAVELGGSVRLARQLELFGRVTNLFDRSYEEVFGFPAQGRSALVGVRVTGSR